MENIITSFFSNFLNTYGAPLKDFIARMLFDECVTVIQFICTKLFTFVNNNSLILYACIVNYVTITISNAKNKYNSKKLKVRCTHDIEVDPQFDSILNDHNQAVSTINSFEDLQIDDARIVPTTFFDINQIDNSRITINIPMVFHLIDPQLSHYPVDYWTTHICTKIISQLNTDYNRNFTNYGNEFINNINILFATADNEKRNYYLGLANALPNNLNVVWNFTLSSVIVKPTENVCISSGSNENIFRSVCVVDPNSFLNVIVAPGTSILGIAVFPFSDRSLTDATTIDDKYVYRNAVLINTMPFLGNKAPYDKFRTFTHEIGHWCGLLHPFDNQTYKTTNITEYGLNKVHLDLHKSSHCDDDQDVVGDMISDTATQTRPTFGTVYDSMITMRKMVNGSIILTKKRNTPFAPIFENNSITPNFLNFMDYTDDNQMCMFTFNQIVKIIYMMSRFRPCFLTVEIIENSINKVVIDDITINEQTIVLDKTLATEICQQQDVTHQIAEVENININENT